MRDVSASEAVERLLRALYEGTTSDPPWVRDWGAAGEMEVLAYDTDQVRPVPYQYLLVSLASDATRDVTRETAEAVQQAANLLLGLLDRFERAQDDERQGEQAKLVALLESPFPVRLPAAWETRDLDAVAIIIRDAGFGGSWDATLRWLDPPRAEWRPIDAARARRLRAFEQRHELDLADVLFGDTAREELKTARDRHVSDPSSLGSANPRTATWLDEIARR
jgi:hypothetical protein